MTGLFTVKFSSVQCLKQQQFNRKEYEYPQSYSHSNIMVLKYKTKTQLILQSIKTTQQYILPKFTLAIFDNIVDNRLVLMNKIHHGKEGVGS